MITWAVGGQQHSTIRKVVTRVFHWVYNINNTYLYEYIKLSQKGTKACY
jgi:hypothetical protein